MPQPIEVGLEYCPVCKRKTPFEWIETDGPESSWYQQTGKVSGRWECTECGWSIGA